MLLAFLLVFLIPEDGYAQFTQPVEPRYPDVGAVAYAPADPEGSRGHLLDLYLPGDAASPAPVVIYTGGSAWFSDDTKVAARNVLFRFSSQGYVVAGVSIRASTQAKFPAQVHDIKAAIRWIRTHAAKYNIDPNKIAIMGDSSGGWASVMAAVTGDVPALEGDLGETGVSSAVQAAIAFYPPTNFLEMDNWAVRPCKPGLAMGEGFRTGEFCHDDPSSPESSLIGCPIQDCPAKTLEADPAAYISPADPPIMILHGQSDLLVPHHQGERLYMALNKACNEAVFVSLPLAGHGPVKAFLQQDEVRAGATMRRTQKEGCIASAPALVTPDWQMIYDFLETHLKD
ncbi:MAG: alpha/beta hydrolase [Bacteroidota bacterium]